MVDLQPSELEQIGDRIRAVRLRKGLDAGHLARAARISRTTLHHIETGQTRSPRMSTLARIAEALGVRVDELCPQPLDAAESLPETFDRETNVAVARVAEEHPELFEGWSPQDWNELYSSFGTGGPLSPEGVIEQAARANRQKRTIGRLQVVLETHLGEIAARLVDALFDLTQPAASQEKTASSPGDSPDETRSAGASAS